MADSKLLPLFVIRRRKTGKYMIELYQYFCWNSWLGHLCLLLSFYWKRRLLPFFKWKKKIKLLVSHVTSFLLTKNGGNLSDNISCMLATSKLYPFHFLLLKFLITFCMKYVNMIIRILQLSVKKKGLSFGAK